MRRTRGYCAYCGLTDVPLEREHVVPRCLYPKSKRLSTVQRVTVLACSKCNRHYSDDEAHFRNVAVLSGEASETVHELWRDKVEPSLDERDGYRRVMQLNEVMQPKTIDGKRRSLIYPGKDARVLRVIRKIIRGLSSFHGIEFAISESRVSASVYTNPLPYEFFEAAGFISNSFEADIFCYHYHLDKRDGSSLWFLTFFERLTFIATVE